MHWPFLESRPHRSQPNASLSRTSARGTVPRLSSWHFATLPTANWMVGSAPQMLRVSAGMTSLSMSPSLPKRSPVLYNDGNAQLLRPHFMTSMSPSTARPDSPSKTFSLPPTACSETFFFSTGKVACASAPRGTLTMTRSTSFTSALKACSRKMLLDYGPIPKETQMLRNRNGKWTPTKRRPSVKNV